LLSQARDVALANHRTSTEREGIDVGLLAERRAELAAG